MPDDLKKILSSIPSPSRGKNKVVIAMSGGVDSSVAAWLLTKKGFKVIGLTALLYQDPDQESERSCCGHQAVDDARAVAQKLGIPHYVINLKEKFASTVIANFCAEYQAGRTPNPCVLCNRIIKWGALFNKARQLGAYYFATGHYARCEYDKKSRKYLLKKGKDNTKDQSYFLYTLTQKELSRTIFPLGNLTKKQARRLAHQAGLSVAGKKASQEICFVPDNDYAAYLRQFMPCSFKPGPIFDPAGRIIGRHKGILCYTIGQRRGLGIAHPKPLYVLAIGHKNNSLIVGPEKELYRKTLLAKDISFAGQAKPSNKPASFRSPKTFKAKVRIRYQGKEAAANIRLLPESKNIFQVIFTLPQRAITPGQAVVFYDKDRVIGGGTILE